MATQLDFCSCAKNKNVEGVMTEAKGSLPDDILAMGFEEALAELEALVKRLEDGKAKLEDSIGAYERGALLRRHCENKLREASARIEQIAANGGEQGVSVSPFSV